MKKVFCKLIILHPKATPKDVRKANLTLESVDNMTLLKLVECF